MEWIKASKELPDKKDRYFVKLDGRSKELMYFNGKRFETYEWITHDAIEWLREEVASEKDLIIDGYKAAILGQEQRIKELEDQLWAENQNIVYKNKKIEELEFAELVNIDLLERRLEKIKELMTDYRIVVKHVVIETLSTCDIPRKDSLDKYIDEIYKKVIKQ